MNSVPCLALKGVIAAVSMPNPPRPQPCSQSQPGTKAGSRGILLPGFTVVAGDGRARLQGPVPPAGLDLPAGRRIDEEGFILPPA